MEESDEDCSAGVCRATDLAIHTNDDTSKRSVHVGLKLLLRNFPAGLFVL